MPINAISTNPQATAIAAYTEVAGNDDGRTRKARQTAQPVDATTPPQQDQVTLSAQALQAQNTRQINQSAEAEQANTNSRDQNRQDLLANSKSINQAINAYQQASLV